MSNPFATARKVRFKGNFCDTFVEPGMKAWLTGFNWDPRYKCFALHFDFTEFEKENEKYFKRNYYDKDGVPRLTAIEAGEYKSKDSFYYSVSDDKWVDEQTLFEELQKEIEFLGEDNDRKSLVSLRTSVMMLAREMGVETANLPVVSQPGKINEMTGQNSGWNALVGLMIDKMQDNAKGR